MCMYICVYGAHRCQKKASNHIPGAGAAKWLLGMEPRACVRAANALDLCVPSLSSPFQISPLAGANALWQLPLSDFSLVPSILN